VILGGIICAILSISFLAPTDLRAERVGGQAQQQGGSHGRLFLPSDLGLLDAPDRDLWQRPDQIMDAMGIADGSVVADIGAGSGWFTIRLARRVGPQGLVYAEDVQKEMINAISRRVGREGLSNVRYVLGLKNDALLPKESLDAVLVVDAYHEVEDRVAMLASLLRALKPQGRIGVVDFKLDGTGPGPSPEERVSPDVVVKDAARAGLRLIRQEPFLPFQYFLIFGK
jgi:predicted methyltransferase